MMYTRFLFYSFFALLTLATKGQMYEPVKWSVTFKRTSDTEGEVVAKATIESKWHVYALVVSDSPDAIGPIPTTLKLDESANYESIGKPIEGKYITHFDSNFEMDLNYFENAATFRQKVKIKSTSAFTLKGELEYMACNDERCVFPDPILIELKVAAASSPAPDENGGGQAPVAEELNATPATADAENGLKDPLHWSFTTTKDAAGQYELIAHVDMDKSWHIYSIVPTPDGGPMPTVFSFLDSAKYSFSGGVREGKAIRKHDPNFMMDVSYFEKSAEFRQTFKVIDPTATVLRGEVTGMTCSDSCIPFGPVSFEVDLASGIGKEYDPLAGQSVAQLDSDPFVWKQVDTERPLSECGKKEQAQGLWAIFLFGIIGGLLALLTPCVFPMIPLTVSFFTKGAEGKKGRQRAITYGFFIVLIYFLLSLPFHLSKNVDPEVLNTISTNVWLNLSFFVIFMVFAISFFGFYEITLPSGLANRVDKASNIGGLVGIFFMALTLAIVSFSCTGPILGTVIGSIYASGAADTVHMLGMDLSLPATKVSAAMLGFGLALGLPFGLFAAFPGMLKKLPRSGGWLQDFKVSLGFLELAFAVKFFSNADLVQQWHILHREVFFAVWIGIGVLWVLYLLGRFAFKQGYHSTTKMRRFKLVFTTILVLMTLRLVPGLFNNEALGKMKFLSGFPPPWTYSFYDRKPEFEIHKNELEMAFEKAKRENKPVFLDFTGWACVNCRKMEDNVWPEPEIKHILDTSYVMVSLYVDEKVELPADKQFVYETRDGRKKRIKTVGNYFATLQTETFRNNSQPFYALLSPDGELLAYTEQYNSDVKEYSEWLQCGVSTFKNLQQNQAALKSAATDSK